MCLNTWSFVVGQGPCGDWSEGKSQCCRFQAKREVTRTARGPKLTETLLARAGHCAPPHARGKAHQHHFTDNHCLVLYTDVYAQGAGGCPPGLETMTLLANNSYYTLKAGNATMQGCGNLATMQKGGSELGSTSQALPTDAEWVAMAKQILKF